MFFASMHSILRLYVEFTYHTKVVCIDTIFNVIVKSHSNFIHL